jgi:hypothetical protein
MENKYWYQEQLRMVQTVLREPDVIDYDAEAVTNYLESVHANVLVINGGGIIDFFRHDLATANPNQFMTNEDILKDITEACHRKGIKVIVRVDFRGVDKRIYDLHPDWFAVDEKGNPIFWADLAHIPNPLYAPCYISYYRNEHAFEFTDIMFEKYDIDGVWENAPFQGGVCYCERCQSSYSSDLGKELPRGGDYYDRSYDEYREWKSANLNRHLEDYRATVKKYGEDKAYCAEIFGLFYDNYKKTGSDLYQVKDHFDFLVTPLFTANDEALSSPSTLIKFLHSLEPNKTPVMLFGHLGSNNELRYVSSSVPETRIWLWQAVSAGGSLWDCIFNGQHPGATYDRRNALMVQDIYDYMKSHETTLSRQEPVQDVTILYSRNSNNIFNNGDRSKDAYITHLIGMEQLLIAEKIQYSFLLDQNLSEETLSKVKVLAIPNGACLSDEEIRLVKEYVYNGGQLLATNETSLYNEHGNARKDFGLNEVFGCNFTGLRKEGSHYGYQYVDHNQAHSMHKGLEETTLLANWGLNLLVKPHGDSECPITYVPQIYPQSPERAWPRSFKTKFPTCVVHSYGKGKSIFFPYGLDRQIWMHGHQDFRTLLANGFRTLIGSEQTLTSNAPQSVQFQVSQIQGSEGDYAVHAVNTTSAPFRPVLEIIPLQQVEVEIIIEGTGEYSHDTMFAGSEIELLDRTILDGNRTKLKFVIKRLGEYSSFLIRKER